MKKCCAFLLLAAGAAGCGTASPWPSYEAALRCHLDGKKTECDAEYQKAIKIDPKTQGLHASFGTHLLLTGRMQEAQREFAYESQLWPLFAPIAIARLGERGPVAAPGMMPAAGTQPMGAPAAGAPAAGAPAPQPAQPAGASQGGVR